MPVMPAASMVLTANAMRSGPAKRRESCGLRDMPTISSISAPTIAANASNRHDAMPPTSTSNVLISAGLVLSGAAIR